MEDLIKREDAIKAYNEAMDELVKSQMEEWNLGDFSECEFNTTDCKLIARKIEAIPSAENKGEWIYPTDIIGFGRCNNCKALWDKSLIDNIYFKYCPRCGARMVK